MEDDNPWAAAESKTKKPSDNRNPATPAPRRADEPQRSCWMSLLKSWLLVDAVIGVLLLIYGVILMRGDSSTHVRTIITLSMLVGSLLFLRGLLGLAGMSHRMPRLGSCGARMNMNYLSPFIVLILLILSIVCGFGHARVFRYLESHADTLHISKRLMEFLDAHHHALWITLLAVSGLEIIRWVFMVRCMLRQQEQNELPLSRSTGRPRFDSRNRPWWWRHSKRNTLQDPLLDGQPYWVSGHDESYIMHENLAQDTTQDSIWSRLRGGIFSPNRDTVRDDDSVDFASVQEEWASRSEEDPLWWSRDEEQPSRQEDE